MRQYVNSNKIIEGIYVCSAVIGGIIVTSMPLLGAMLLVIAFLAGRLVKLVTIRQIQIRAELGQKVGIAIDFLSEIGYDNNRNVLRRQK